MDCFYTAPFLSLPFPHPKLAQYITIPCFLLPLYTPDHPLNTSPSSLSPMSMFSSDVCHDFHILYLPFSLSSKRPNTRSNHDMALSYLFFLFTLQSHTRQRQGKQIVLEYQYRTIYSSTGTATHLFSLFEPLLMSFSTSASYPP